MKVDPYKREERYKRWIEKIELIKHSKHKKTGRHYTSVKLVS